MIVCIQISRHRKNTARPTDRTLLGPAAWIVDEAWSAAPPEAPGSDGLSHFFHCKPPISNVKWRCSSPSRPCACKEEPRFWVEQLELCSMLRGASRHGGGRRSRWHHVREAAECERQRIGPLGAEPHVACEADEQQGQTVKERTRTCTCAQSTRGTLTLMPARMELCLSVV